MYIPVMPRFACADGGGTGRSFAPNLRDQLRKAVIDRLGGTEVRYGKPFWPGDMDRKTVSEVPTCDRDGEM